MSFNRDVTDNKSFFDVLVTPVSPEYLQESLGVLLQS